jgi:hypothetical protein
MGLGIAAAAAAAVFLSGVAYAQDKACGGLPNATTGVHGIALGDAESAVRVLGHDFQTVIDDATTDFPWLIFASRDNKQLLMLRHHRGDAINAFAEIEVKFGRHGRDPMKLPVYEFIAGNDIKLGQWRRTIVGKLGECFTSKREGETEILRYEIKNGAAPSAATGPTYYAEYEFFGGRLHRFRFGHAPE